MGGETRLASAGELITLQACVIFFFSRGASPGVALCCFVRYTTATRNNPFLDAPVPASLLLARNSTHDATDQHAGNIPKGDPFVKYMYQLMNTEHV